ncbi:MAG: hypothetical protein ACRDKT_09490 [Actinomycetota bacterium]
MGLGDWIRSFFAKRNNPALEELEMFVSSHKGIEGFIEPRTSTSPTTLLLVDRYGEHLRAPVREPDDARTFCEGLSIPVYDAPVVGYPKRMRDFEKRRRHEATDSLEDDFAELEKRLEADAGPDIPDR